MAQRIETKRLVLISACAEHIRAELESVEKFEAVIGAEVPEGWPPGEYDKTAQEYFLKLLSENDPDSEGWYSWYAILNKATSGKPVVIGAGGYTGKPDESGDVEIGYSVVSSYQRKGYATEFMNALVLRAFSDSRVKRITAHTTPENTASCKVLEKLGFTNTGPGAQFGTVKFVLDKTN